MNEDLLLLRISIDQALASLEAEEDRVMVSLYYQLEEPPAYPGYVGPWPTTLASVAEYVGTRFGSGPLAESTIRYRMRLVLTEWRKSGQFNH
jgi:hypothetical protein